MIQPNNSFETLKNLKIHFVGIGGIGMSALARYYNSCNSTISGSDREDSPLLSELKKEGIKDIWTPHSREKIKSQNPDLVIYSTAIEGNTNEEILWAKENNINLMHRSDLLEITSSSKNLISVSGTHGKTTTSSMMYEVFNSCNLNPSAILGGLLISKNTNSICGSGDYFITEADESDKSFLKGNPEISIITNIEPDHLENYSGGFEEIKSSFLQFAKKPKNGLVVCFEDKNTRDLISRNLNIKDSKIIRYGFNEKECNLIAVQKNESKDWTVIYNSKELVSFKLTKPGKHNVLNALACIGTAILLNLDLTKVKLALEDFQGAKRRFEVLGTLNKITFVDDYAHHPTEIIETIKAAKELLPKRLVVVFQPHQPGRTKDLWDDFINAFKGEDFPIFITDIYIARGKPIEGINSKNLVDSINKPNIQYLPGSLDEISKAIKNTLKENDLVLIMGAGSITLLGQILIDTYKDLKTESIS